MELKNWLKNNDGQVLQRWKAGIRVREGRRGEEDDGFLGLFLEHLVSFLPHCLGDSRDSTGEVWQQATHLYGSLALHRGLAAGEVVEELQLLRRVILKLLLEAPPEFLGLRENQRDLLALNELLDLGVVRASVAYVDDLFFAHLQGSGVPEGVTSDVVEEMARQLKSFQRELETTRWHRPEIEGPHVRE